ncbi:MULTISPECIES: monovalent cation/H+ antiporter complex subunit F [unclassified Microbulbifer]|uniref:Monovalent cation/H+ antiporter complex subunit F n=1 Tax=Microbulbifer spongiae TaxID=2944933 RepID=A0ABY9EEM7_9GAMM|nr:MULTISPECIES: monovalent cation/H+ antiporter complex subunit F [unclassified Microbulbifer]MDP5209772.1 monovalent cation/H+ antiporter complex subunit F [Microbulbifer sp. 2205BS26-8]WKD50446.1 monovalent cation/H+ antiporter complex subunit F [Microbulbifer sp. MI-G]
MPVTTADIHSSIIMLAVSISSLMLLLALVMCFLRIALGPTLADRVVALDVLNILAVAYCALLAIASAQPVYLDAAIALALVAFLVSVAFARFIEKSGKKL